MGSEVTVSPAGIVTDACPLKVTFFLVHVLIAWGSFSYPFATLTVSTVRGPVPNSFDKVILTSSPEIVGWIRV